MPGEVRGTAPRQDPQGNGTAILVYDFVQGSVGRGKAEPTVAEVRGGNRPVIEKVAQLFVVSRAEIEAGHGIVSKSLRYGVPMVLLPWDRDQPGVAARAERLGVAQVVPREYANPEEVKEAVTAVLDDAQYREAAALQSDRLEAIDGVAIACNLLEEM